MIAMAGFSIEYIWQYWRQTIPTCLPRQLARYGQLILLSAISVFASTSSEAINADKPSEQQLKASFIYHFPKFIKWPTPPATNTKFVICVLGNHPLSGNIELLNGKRINEQDIEIKLISQPLVNTCHVLFIAESEAGTVADILSHIADVPILSISDIPDFTQAGGMIEMKLIDDKIRFDINLNAAEKAGLNINSQLLKLATQVIQ